MDVVNYALMENGTTATILIASVVQLGINVSSQTIKNFWNYVQGTTFQKEVVRFANDVHQIR